MTDKEIIYETLDYRAEKITELESEIERLNEAIDERDLEISQLYKRLDRVKSEAVKEFAEKLKLKSSCCYATDNGIKVAGSSTYTISEIKLYNLVKEMVGEG